MFDFINTTPRAVLGLIIIIFFGIFLNVVFFSTDDFSEEKIFRIEKGETLDDVTKNLKREKFITNAFIFKVSVKILGRQSKIKAGDYFFEKPISLFEMIQRLTNGKKSVELRRITILEGWTIERIAGFLEEQGIAPKQVFLFAKANDFSDIYDFLEELPSETSLEGYFFPDTYFMKAGSDSRDVIKATLENLSRKITTEMRGDIERRNLSIFDVLIMASLIEKEVSNEDDRRIVSGILWKRIEIGMPLQVDATLTYILEKQSLELTDDDLKIDSPYNTYKYYGLPVGPIANPGLDAIEAAIYPVETPYLYYLSDRDGNTYFSRTFEEHKENKFKYLR